MSRTTMGIVVVLVVLILVIAFDYFSGGHSELKVRVAAQQYSWDFAYADEKGSFDPPNSLRSSGELHVPVNKDVSLELESADVPHNLSIPELHLDISISRGKTSYGQFNAKKTGAFDILCSLVCGTGHAGMRGTLVVDSQEDFENWKSARLKNHN